MSPLFRGGTRTEKPAAGLATIPEGAHLIPTDVKKQYEANPTHLYHPTPYNAITILRSKANPHDWLVCGWYLDTYRENGAVKGLVYRMVSSNEEKEFVAAELKKVDKEAVVRFSL
jgi:hypothetical protein